MLDASIVGSLPKPVWLAAPNMLKAPSTTSVFVCIIVGWYS